MGLYHFTAKVVSRGKGGSAVHTAAYNAREQLHDERENRDTKDYGTKGETEFSGIFAPKDAPDWARDREQLWNHAEAAEHRKDSQTARNVEFALPHELNAEQRRRLVTDFVRETFARRGMVADVHIHAPHDRNDERNHHVHCLLTMRRLEGDEFAAKKETQWNSKEELGQWREKWAQMGGRALERAGHEQEADRFRHGHRTLAGQREAALERGDHEWAQHCDKEAQIHKGAAVSGMEKRADPRLADNEIARESRAIDDRNAVRAEIRATEKELAAARQEPEQQREPTRPRPEATRQPPEPSQQKPEPQPERWHQREATKTEERIFRVMDAAERGGASVVAGLHAEGLTLARVDAAGKANIDRDYVRQFENAKLAGNADARMRRTTFKEGELVAVNRYGDVYRINPRFIDTEKLERAATGGIDKTPTLSAAREFFATGRKQAREERAAAQHERYQNRQEPFIGKGRDESAGLKVNVKGAAVALSSFVESLFGMGAASSSPDHQQQQHAPQTGRGGDSPADPWEEIYEAVTAGRNIPADSIRHLPPADLENLRSHGDAAINEKITDMEREKAQEAAQSWAEYEHERMGRER